MTARHYYNEFDPHAAAWLRELMAAGLIPAGVVDERDIREVSPDDVLGFTACHFFAGIGGWPHALRLAGWPDDRPVWTGSCPCQPYSAAGKGLGDADPRNLWPAFFRLIRECRPDVCFGEQVEGAIRHGWLDRVCADLEGEGYAVGSVVLGAHSVGAPHIRQRLYWVADHTGPGRSEWRAGEKGNGRTDEPQRLRHACPVADSDGGLAGDGRVQPGREHGQQPQDGEFGVTLGDTKGDGREQGGGDANRDDGAAMPRGTSEPLGTGCHAGGLGHANGGRREGGGGRGIEAGGSANDATPRGETGFWSAFDLIPCRDGKARRVEPGLFPLAHGIPGRVGLLRGAGNAICPHTAAAFIQAYREAKGE